MLSSNLSPIRPGVPIYTAEIVTRCLDLAGMTMMAILVGRIGPASYRSCMPTPLRAARDYFAVTARTDELLAEAAAERWRVRPPTAAEIAHRDEVYLRWLPLIGGEMSWQQQRERLVRLRMLRWPDAYRDDPHVWSWPRLGRALRVDPRTARAWHDRAVNLLASALRRGEHAPCAATLRLIGELERRRAHAAA